MTGMFYFADGICVNSALEKGNLDVEGYIIFCTRFDIKKFMRLDYFV